MKQVDPVAVAVPETGADVPLEYVPCEAVPAILKVFPPFEFKEPWKLPDTLFTCWPETIEVSPEIGHVMAPTV